VLYESLDVTALVRPGANALGVMLGHGWWAQPSVRAGPRQLIALLSVTTADGATTYYPSTLAAAAPPVAAGGVVPLVFTATSGPVLADDIYDGETFSGPLAAALAGWAQPGYTPTPGVAWVPAEAPPVSPATYGSVVSAHPVPIRTDRTFSVAPGGISQPGPGVYVFDFGQNMAGA
jgi:alpha-L-rhamnosidase